MRYRNESEILRSFSKLDFSSMLEVGCDFERMTDLIMERLKPNSYVAFDMSPGQIQNARKNARAGAPLRRLPH